MGRGVQTHPKAGKEPFENFAQRVLAGRRLQPRTLELYQGLLERHLLPTFGALGMSEITPSSVRGWYGRLARQHPSTAAKAYRLLNTIMRVAVADDVIARSPCRVEGAGAENAPERPIATVAELGAMVEAMPERLRALLLLATWCHLRRNELLALRRRDVDLLHKTVSVTQALQRVKGQGLSFKEPKSRAGHRTVAIPPHIVPALTDHLTSYVAADPDALVFTGEKGGPLEPPRLYKEWHRARLAIGRPELHLHDLRHSGNTWAAATGASTKELMARMGHDSPQAALRYQHASADRDRVIADALAELVRPAPVVPLVQKLGHVEGTTGARVVEPEGE
jgi:integrase